MARPKPATDLRTRKGETGPDAREEQLGCTIPDFDRVIHERVRLGIVSALAVNESVTFNQLKATLDTTDGNLSAHSRKLEAAGYVQIKKSFEGRLPKTEFRLTASGRKALKRYLDHMEALIRATRQG